MLAAAASVASLAARTLPFTYRAHDGARAKAYLVVPSWYGPRRHPALPLVVSPHGRGVDGRYNLRFWGALPARGRFALVSPDGHGRRLPLYSWGYPGQIADLARMGTLARRAFPWLRLDRRVYGVGASMGGQEVLLLAARTQLTGVAAFDAATDMRLRYRAWFVTAGESHLPALGRREIGGTPASVPAAYRARSPIDQVAAIVRHATPIQLWWSRNDRVVTDGAAESGALFDRLRGRAPVQQIVGLWQHAHAMHPETQLPAALACLGLLPFDGIRVPPFRETEAGIEESEGPEVPLTAAFCGAARR
jgi:poly(3-hydroxybutyrate) depolymerase